MANSTNGADISEDTKTGLNNLAKASRLLELHGHGDRIWGHVAMRDPEGRGFWMKRHAISLGEAFDWRDFQLLDFEGKLQHGTGRRHSEWPIHGEIFQLRSDINFTAHTHPFYSSAFSSIPEALKQVRGGTPIVPARYEGSSELVTTRERGRELAEALGNHHCIFMRNHGVVFGGATPVEMVKLGTELEESCRMTLTVNGSGFEWKWPDDDEMSRKGETVGSYKRNDPLWDYYLRLLARAEASGDIRLSQGQVPPS